MPRHRARRAAATCHAAARPIHAGRRDRAVLCSTTQLHSAALQR
uniref:DUF1534 domain-containing protein n=1 Tax=Macrostomum lignano TaxID=282301 RepID=A0A1I8JMS6_9PLAT